MIFSQKKNAGEMPVKPRQYSQFGLKLNEILRRMPLRQQYIIAKSLMLVLTLFIALRLAIGVHSVYMAEASLAAVIIIAGIILVGYRMVKK